MKDIPRILLRWLLALVVVIAPLTLAGWFAGCPQYGDPTCPSSIHPLDVLVAFRAAEPHIQRAFLLANLLAPYVYPLSYLILGMLALRRSPWFAVLGMVCGWIGGTAWGFIADTIIHIDLFAHSGTDQAFVSHENSLYQTPYIFAVAVGWVLGHLLGYVLLGIAHYRARIIPRWAAVLLILSAPLMGPLAYGLNIAMLQIGGYLLVLVASIPAARAVIQSKNGFLDTVQSHPGISQ